ncbi:SDR family oxidoreductase [Dyella sp. C9]|uniref:SDR family NAD(P)-dependent oxidoreductase n=1 Tax=Dyella sp. C9 TaxID=2202154 RepID=UPI000DEF774F|nr:SDR family oxidoreductase [Dyella sp. C9]
MELTEPLDTALVTGASSGIGAAYADRLARRGHDLVLVARSRARLEALAEELARLHGVRVDALVADLTAPDQRSVVEQRLREDDAIGILVNNAGRAGGGPMTAMALDDIEAMIALNVTAPTRLTGAILPRLIARGRGSVINIASVLALAPERFGGAYAASKGYLLNFTLGLQQEAAAHGVRMQAVLPGMTRTDIWTHADSDPAAFPAGMVMEVDEMVDAALAGYDQGEIVTLPSLPDGDDWERYEAARRRLLPLLSRDHAADRYKSDIPEDA